MASGRSRAILGFGVAHFATYAVVVWFLAPMGIEVVAIVAAVVHTAFVIVSYLMMVRGSVQTVPAHSGTTSLRRGVLARDGSGRRSLSLCSRRRTHPRSVNWRS